MIDDKLTVIEYWKKASSDLGLEVESPFVIYIGCTRIKATMLIKNFGAPKGMLIIDSFCQVEKVADKTSETGYGFLVDSRPTDSNDYCRDSFIDMLKDWGWTGAASEKPIWMSQK